MSKLYCFSGVIENIIYYDGTTQHKSPYGSIGDIVCVCVFCEGNTPLLTAIVMESYGTMTPSNSHMQYFNSPFDWNYNNSSTTNWTMRGNVFSVESDAFNPPFRIDCKMSLIVNPI